VSEELSDFPAALRDTETYPWEESEPPILWPFGNRAGTPLGDFSSTALVRMRGEVERRNGRGSYFDFLLASVDEVLLARMGE
jgi:hypothetical protein